MRNPIRILVKKEEPKLCIRHVYIAVFVVEREEWKLAALCDLFETLTITQVPRGGKRK